MIRDWYLVTLFCLEAELSATVQIICQCVHWRVVVT